MRYRQILVALEKAGFRYVIVGGMAEKLRGTPREPRDLDLVIDPAAGEPVMDILLAHGFYPTIPLAFHQVTVLRFLDQDGQEIDVFARFVVPFEELFAHAERLDYDGVPVCTAALADLVLANERTGR